MKNLRLLLAAFALLFTISCSTSQGTPRVPEKRGNSLANELRKLPGIQVRGDDVNGSVQIGGYSSSITGNNNPLFIMDGIRLGNSLTQAATIVNVPEIKNIRVIRPKEAFTQYGTDGSNGVILIRMNQKKKEE